MNFFTRDDEYKAGFFFTEDQQHTVSSLIGDAHSTPGNVGVCLSGGGSRALTCGMGQLRALKRLQLNGTSLLGQVKAISTVSGGSWVGVPFLYLDQETSDDDYLNRYVEDQTRLVLKQTPGHTLAETLDELPANNIGQGPAELTFSPPALAISALILHSLFKVPVDLLWQTLVGMHILKDYQLYDPKVLAKTPTTFFSYNEQVLNQDVLDQNPELKDETALLYMQTDEQRVHRPFLICNMSMFVTLPGEQQDYLVPVQMTPFFTGVVGNPKNALDKNGVAVGGGGVTSFAFNSWLVNAASDEIEVEQKRAWALVDGVGVSSAFFAEKLNDIFDEMRKKPELIKKYCEENNAAVEAWIKKILPVKEDGLFDRLLGLLEGGADRIENLILSESEISEILDDIDMLIPEYLYWLVKDANPHSSLKINQFADGGNLENTGVASLLSYQDIDNIIAFVNTSTPMSAGDKGVLDENGNEIPDTRIVVDSQVPPLFGYQPYDEKVGYQLYTASDNPKDPEFKFNQVFESTEFADLLIKMWQASGNEQQPGANLHPAICKQTLAVLENTWFGVKARGGAGDSKEKINIVWYYNNRARDWYDSLNAEVQDLLGDFDDPDSYNSFPHYSTFSSHLNKTEINLLANYTAWAVAAPDNSTVFSDLFKDPD